MQASYDSVHGTVASWFDVHADDCEAFECALLPVDFVADAVWAGLDTALWSSTDETGVSLQSAGCARENIAEEVACEFAREVADFCHAMAREITAAGLGAGTVGHNFVLTRNREGAGFWDLGLGENGDELTASAHPYGEFTLWADEHGDVYA